MAKNALLENYFKPKEQWGMSSADSLFGMSLPEYHPNDTNWPTEWDKPDWLENLSDILEEPEFSAIDSNNIPVSPRLSSTDLSLPQTQKAFNKFMGLDGGEESLTRAQKAMFQGAILKTVAAASDFFSRATAIIGGQQSNIKGQVKNTQDAYQNQMDALDNQVLYIKHQLADRFNKMVDTNIVNMAAKNIRVTGGNVLELTKDTAQEMTEDMRMTESNARLKQIALEAGKKSAKESGKLAVKQMWAGLVSSATKLGMMWETGGGTGMSFGDLYAGYNNALKTEDAIKNQEFNKLY